VRHTLTIARRELGSLFSTPVGWVVLSAYLVMAGYFFFVGLGVFLQQLQQIQAFQLTHLLDQFNLNERVIAPALGSFSIILVFLIPLVTMRMFAEERANGTFELLLTSPLSAWEIVLGKYLATATVIVLLVALSGLFPALLFLYGDPEWLQTVAGLLGLLGYGLMLGALGCLASALTRSQMIAAVVAVFAGLLFYLLEFAAQLAPEGFGRSLIHYVAIGGHFEPWLRGEIRTQDLAYFALSIVFMLSVVRLLVESLRWR
jgi:ABC-2 type transport system permease protein